MARRSTRRRRSGRRRRGVVRSGRRHTSRVHRRRGGFGKRRDFLSKYFPTGIVPAVGGAAVGFAAGSAIKLYLQTKSVEKSGKAGFTGTDIGSAAFDVAHAAAAWMFLPRRLGALRKGYAVGAALPTATYYATKAVAAAQQAILKTTGGASNDGRQNVRVMPPSQQGTALAATPSKPNVINQIIGALPGIIGAVSGSGASSMAGFDDDNDDSPDYSLAYGSPREDSYNRGSVYGQAWGD